MLRENWHICRDLVREKEESECLVPTAEGHGRSGSISAWQHKTRAGCREAHLDQSQGTPEGP